MKKLLTGHLYIYILLLLLAFSNCQEDTIEPALFGSIVGEVLLEDDNIAIEMATISTNPPTSQVFTDELGRFALESIKTGTYSLRSEKNGFITQVATVSITSNQTSNVIIRMRPDSLDNNPPQLPFNPFPADGGSEQPIDVRLEWEAFDADEDDQLFFDVLLFNADQTQSVNLLEGSTDQFVEVMDLEYNTNYLWQVVVTDGVTEPIYGPVWSFMTETFPEHRLTYARINNGKYDIYSADETGNMLKLTNSTTSSWRPRMNPSRSRIAFISNAGIEPQIYTMKRDGSDIQQVTNIPISGANPLDLDFCWSPDGTRLLYMVDSRLYTINQDGTGLNLFADAPFGFTFAECDWTAQGNKIIARTQGLNAYNATIFTFDEDGNYQLQAFTDVPGTTGGPAFSIDGNKMLYTQDISGFESPDGRQLDAHVFIKDLQTNAITDISVEKPGGTNDLDPRFSPDGAKIIFVNTNNDGISARQIWIMDLDGDNRSLLFENGEMPDWR